MQQTVQKSRRRLVDMEKAIWSSGIVQAMLLLSSSLILDGRMIFFMSCLMAVVLHWVVFAIIALRRRNNLTRFDAIFVIYGFLIYICVLPFVSLLLQVVWRG